MGKRWMALCLAFVCFLCSSVTARAEASVVHVRTEERVVALTFDDGPHPRYTARILAVLEKYGVKATFFEVGVNVARYPEAACAVAEAGHEIGNHTYHHPHISGMGDAAFEEEVNTCTKTILETTGVSPVLFRPPEGVRGETRFACLTALGYRQILWNLDTCDWQGRRAGDIVQHVMRHVRGGDILLFHDYVAGELYADVALDQLIPAMEAEGYRFVTVSELLTRGEIVEPHF